MTTLNDTIQVHDLAQVVPLAAKIASSDPTHANEDRLVEDHRPACLVGHVLDRLGLLAQLTWENPEIEYDDDDGYMFGGIDDLPGARDHFTEGAYDFLSLLQEKQDEGQWLPAFVETCMEKELPVRVEVPPLLSGR